MRRGRSWNSTARAIGLAAVALLGLALAGCGGGESDSDQITALVLDYYEHPDQAQCKVLTTDHFRGAVYGGSGSGALAACEEHQRLRAKMPALARTAFVDHLRIDGDRAIAEARGGGITLTEALVRSGDGWRLDDELSPFHAPPGGPARAQEQAKQTGPQPLGTPSEFTNIPGIPPSAAVRLVVEQPIDPGVDRSGERSAQIRFGNDFGQPGAPEEVRFVNVPVTLTNTGSTPFRGEVSIVASDAKGHEFTPLDRRDIAQTGNLLGKLPDWTQGEEQGIPRGASSTRYLTFAVPVDDRIVEWRVEPRVLSDPGTVSAMEPIDGVVYGATASAGSA